LKALSIAVLFSASAPVPISAGAPVPISAGAPVPISAVELAASDLDALLGLGPQGILAATVFEPVAVGRRFVGWRVVSFRAGGPLENVRAVVPGDVITRLNSEPLERPEQFMKAWETLRAAEVIALEVVRANTPLTLRWRVRR